MRCLSNLYLKSLLQAALPTATKNQRRHVLGRSEGTFGASLLWTVHRSNWSCHSWHSTIGNNHGSAFSTNIPSQSPACFGFRIHRIGSSVSEYAWLCQHLVGGSSWLLPNNLMVRPFRQRTMICPLQDDGGGSAPSTKSARQQSKNDVLYAPASKCTW